MTGSATSPSVSFGETIPVLSRAVPFGGHWEVGLQAGVFAIFDMNSDSHDLVNADYFVGAGRRLRGRTAFKPWPASSTRAPISETSSCSTTGPSA